MLQILSVSIFEKMALNTAFLPQVGESVAVDAANQLHLFDF
jgi:hypothetical protein